MVSCITQDTNLFLRTLQAMSKQVQALTKVVGKKEEQLQALRHHQTHMTTTIEQLQGEVKKNGAAAAADKAAKTYAADLQTKVSLCLSLYALLFTAQQLTSASVLSRGGVLYPFAAGQYSCNSLAIVLALFVTCCQRILKYVAASESVPTHAVRICMTHADYKHNGLVRVVPALSMLTWSTVINCRCPLWRKTLPR